MREKERVFSVTKHVQKIFFDLKKVSFGQVCWRLFAFPGRLSMMFFLEWGSVSRGVLTRALALQAGSRGFTAVTREKGRETYLRVHREFRIL